MKSCESNEIAAYRDPRLGVILREVEPTDSRTQEDGVMRTWVRSRWQVSDKITLGDEVAIAVEFVCCGKKNTFLF